MVASIRMEAPLPALGRHLWSSKHLGLFSSPFRSLLELLSEQGSTRALANSLDLYILEAAWFEGLLPLACFGLRLLQTRAQALGVIQERLIFRLFLLLSLLRPGLLALEHAEVVDVRLLLGKQRGTCRRVGRVLFGPILKLRRLLPQDLTYLTPSFLLQFAPKWAASNVPAACPPIVFRAVPFLASLESLLL